VKISKKEIGLAVLLAVSVTTLAAYTNSPHLKQGFISDFGLTSEESMLRSMWGLSDTQAKVDQQAWQVWETIEGELRQGTFETVVSQLEALTEAKYGYIYSEDLFFRDNLWSGEVVSKIPQENMSSFVFGTKALIEANGTVISITTTVRTTVSPDKTEEVSYSTIKTTLKEATGAEPPQAITQILSVIPWLVTGLVWIAEGLIIGVPLCFVSLGIIILVDRGILPVWKKQLSKSRSG
jgi:hypothetical protein